MVHGKKVNSMALSGEHRTGMIMEKSMYAGHDMVDIHAWSKYNIEKYIQSLELVDVC